MDLQLFIVLSIIAFAGVFFAAAMYRRARAFKPNSPCSDECGCSSAKQRSN